MQIHPVMLWGLQGQPERKGIIPEDLKTDIVADFKERVSTRYLGMTRKPLSEGLDGDMMYPVDGRMPVPVHMTGKTQKHRAALLDDLTRGGAVMVMPHTRE